jgi:recombination protein RecT
VTNPGNGLRDRVRDQRTRQQGNGAEVAKSNEQAQATMRQFIDSMTGEMARALPKHLNADRMARIVLTEVRRTPLLARCTQQSFGGALMTCAQLGLEPGVTGEAYLTPFRNKKKNIYEVQLIIGYQGMAKLFWQSPLARSLDAQAVYENDPVFDYSYGLEPTLVHQPLLTGDRGKAIAYYAVARMQGGGSAFVVMSPTDIAKIRERSRAKDDGPWQTDEDAMSKKTCVRQLFKLLPRSPELSRALAHDEAVRTDMSESGIDLTPEYADAIPGEVEDTDQSAMQDANDHGEPPAGTVPPVQVPPLTDAEARERAQQGTAGQQAGSLDWPES